MKNIKLIEVPSEIGAGTRGASLGIEAVKIEMTSTIRILLFNFLIAY